MKILFFAPHSAIWAHAFPEALVAESLVQQGNDVIYVGCDGLLKSHCVSMSAFGVSVDAELSEKDRVCTICKKNKYILRSRFGFVGNDLTELSDPADAHYADQVVASVTPNNCLELMLDNVEVGKIALYELLLKWKKNTLDFSSVEWQHYQVNLKNTILTLRCVQRLFDMSDPDRVVVYNALYSVNRVVCQVARLGDVPQYFLHAGANLSNRLQTLWLGYENTFSFYSHMVEKWNDLKDTPCSANELSAVTDHFLEVVQGRSAWAYSVAPKGSNDELRSFFGVLADQKVICATMSSYDERFAGEVVGAIPRDIASLFTTQVDWINALVKYVARRKNLFLIIRVHPREFPNKREGVLSEHAKMLQKVLADLPENVCVNWPTDSVSLYSVANITDVFVNSWSSVGKEMGLLGLPVVLYSHGLTDYPSDLNYVGTTHDEYFQMLERAIEDGWDAERIRKTYRWCVIEYYRVALDISESFDRKENQKISFTSRVKNKLARSIAPNYLQYADFKNRAERLSVSADINIVIRDKLNSVLDINRFELNVTLLDETNYLKKEVGRLIEGLYATETDAKENSLLWKLKNFSQI